MLMRSLTLLASLAAPLVLAQPNAAPNPDPTDTNNPILDGKRFPFDDLPEQADTTDSPRGMQTGYNRCNATTEGPDSMCQTLIVNSLADFCLFAPPKPDSTIGDTEEEEVVWCTQKGHGARLIPPGTFTGAQFITTPSYLEVTGILNQTLVNMAAGDGGGELDSAGQDHRGNPIGGLVYSMSFPGHNGTYTQSVTWSTFIGSNVYCAKFCTLTAPNAEGICQHIYDTIGCNTNVPAAYQDGVFLQCLGDDQDPVAPGDTHIPASSSCTTYQSSDIYPQPTTTTMTTTTTTSTSSTSSSSTSGTSSPNKSTAAPNARAKDLGLGLLVVVAAGLIGATIVV